MSRWPFSTAYAKQRRVTLRRSASFGASFTPDVAARRGVWSLGLDETRPPTP